MVAHAKPAGNGTTHPDPLGTLFADKQIDKGVIEGFGHVVLREAQLAEVWPYMTDDSGQAAEFGMRVLAASLLINGHPVTFDELGKVGMSHMKVLQQLLPEVQELNGLNRPLNPMGDDDEDGEGDAPNPAMPGAGPAGSQSETGS